MANVNIVGSVSMTVSPFVSITSWSHMAVGAKWCSRNERIKVGPTIGTSRLPHVSAIQCTTPDMKSAKRIPQSMPGCQVNHRKLVFASRTGTKSSSILQSYITRYIQHDEREENAKDDEPGDLHHSKKR